MDDQAAELAHDIEVINRALESSRLHLTALARAEDARELRRPTHSPLLTLVEHAEKVAARLTHYLRQKSAPVNRSSCSESESFHDF